MSLESSKFDLPSWGHRRRRRVGNFNGCENPGEPESYLNSTLRLVSFRALQQEIIVAAVVAIVVVVVVIVVDIRTHKQHQDSYIF